MIEITVQTDEYEPGVFDLVDIKEQTMQKLLSLLSCLSIEVTNVLKGVEIKYYDPLILFGDTGELEPDELDEGDIVQEVS